MFKVSVMYPNEDGVKFDFDYYCNTHMKLVKQYMEPCGLQRVAVDKGLPAPDGQKAPYVCVGSLYFDRADGYSEGGKKAGTALRDDIANFTNVTPLRLFSEVLD